MKKDIITKVVLKQIAEDISQYLLNLDVKDIEFVDKELQVVEKRESDLVGHCTINGIESILHIEIQNNNDNTMHHRMLRYYALITSRFPELPIHQFVIYIGKDKLSMQSCINREQLHYQYELIDMHSIDCDKLIAMNQPAALVLAVLCDFKGKPEKEVLLRILTGLEALTKDDEYAYSKYTLALETLSDNRNLKEKLKEAEEMLRTVRMEQLPSYEIGFEKGELRGEGTGMVKAIREMFSIYFPTADFSQYLTKLSDMTEVKLTGYIRRMTTAKTPEEVFADDEEVKGSRPLY
jgi:predicted transposase YdaD